MEMEKLSRESLSNALTPAARPLQRQLSSADGSTLTALLERTLRRYQGQENQDAMEEYLTDFEQLSLRYSLQSVEGAMESLRISPEQRFFPRPDEIAAEIERQRTRRQRELDTSSTNATREQLEAWRQEHTAYMESLGYVRIDGRWEGAA